MKRYLLVVTFQTVGAPEILYQSLSNFVQLLFLPKTQIYRPGVDKF